MTEPFTPSTDQVRDAYSYDAEYEYYHPDDPGYHHANRAAFDRWLAQVKADAWDEGYSDGRFNADPLIANPYRV